MTAPGERHGKIAWRRPASWSRSPRTWGTARSRQDDYICTGHLLWALALPMAPDASVSATGFFQRKQRSQDPAFYDCAQRLLSDVARSLDRVGEIRTVL